MTEHLRSPKPPASCPRRLPFLQRYDDQIIVVKYGGHAMVDPALARQLRPRHGDAQSVRHQPDRGAWRRAADQPDARQARGQGGIPRRLAGHRPGDHGVVEMVLAGSINKSIVASIQQAGGTRRRHFRQGWQSADRRALRAGRRPIPRPARSRRSISALSASRSASTPRSSTPSCRATPSR